jgi:hypothetical protein
MNFREKIIQEALLTKRSLSTSFDPKRHIPTVKGNPATFYNPIQNNQGQNLQMFIEHLYQ